MSRTLQHLFWIAPLALTACSGTVSTGAVDVALSAWESESSDDIALRTFGHQTAHDLKSAVVVVREIDVQVPGQGWVPVMMTPRTVDLLALDGKTLTSLGITSLPVGRACKLRFVIYDSGAYVVTKTGQQKPLDVPDNGIVVVVGEIKLEPCASGTIIVDFDPKIKIENGNYVLRCKAKIKTSKMKGACNPDGGGSTPDLGAPADMTPGSCAGVVCPIGQVCMGGVCVADPCAGVVCPPGQVCMNGVCGAPDPCAGVTCPPGQMCQNGVCMGNPDMSRPPDMADKCNK
jgi:hypothetical protein